MGSLCAQISQQQGAPAEAPPEAPQRFDPFGISLPQAAAGGVPPQNYWQGNQFVIPGVAPGTGPSFTPPPAPPAAAGPLGVNPGTGLAVGSDNDDAGWGGPETESAPDASWGPDAGWGDALSGSWDNLTSSPANKAGSFMDAASMLTGQSLLGPLGVISAPFDLAMRARSGQGLIGNFMDAWGPANTIADTDEDQFGLGGTRDMTPAEIGAFNDSMTDPATHAGSWDIDPATGNWTYTASGTGDPTDPNDPHPDISTDGGDDTGTGSEEEEASSADQDDADSGGTGSSGDEDDGSDQDQDDADGGYHTGGKIPGKGGKMIKAKGGEFVIRNSAANYYGPAILKALNSGKISREGVENLLARASRSGRQQPRRGG